MIRSTAVTMAMAVALLVAACTGGPSPSDPATASVSPAPAAPSSTPSSTPSPVPSPTPTTAPEPLPSFAAPDADTIQAAADALDALDSYRFTIAMSNQGMDSQGEGVVVNGDAPRSSLTTRAGDLVAVQVTIAGRTWYSMAGSPWMHEPRMDADPTDPWVNPITSTALGQLASLDRFEEAGVERRDGRLVRHVRGIADPSDPADADDLFGTPGDWFTGTIDAWILVEEGRLVAVEVDGVTDLGGWGEEEPSNPVPFAVAMTVAGEDDPSNAVEEPVVTEPAPVPSSEPEAAALAAGVADALAHLDAYEIGIESEMGITTTATLTVVNRPVHAAMQIMEMGPGPIADLSILVIGKNVWSSWGGEGWTKATKDNHPTCGRTGMTDEMEPCTFEALSGIPAALADTEGLVVVGRGEIVDGYACTHLRSTAPMASGGLAIPGTTDTWIAEDGGFLVRTTFTGQGVSSSASITRVNDPTLRLEPPGD